MEEEVKKAPIFPIGNKRYICVEYPGNVKNVNRALETFGGEKAISQFYDSVKKYQSEEGSKPFIKPIELKYRPKDPYCHSIEGNVLPTNRLLLKVTRRRKKDQPEEEAELKTDILGVIPYTCRFRSLADFQYIVPKSNRMNQLRTSILNGKVNDLMNYKPNFDNDDNNLDLENIPPPSFSSINTPFRYDYKQNALVVRIKVKQPDGTYVTKLVTKRFNAPKLITNISFDQKETPMKSKFDLPVLEENALLVKEKILKLYEKRPVWSRIALKAQLEPSERVHLINVLIHTCYCFSNGPWRDCWIKFGVEVRNDPMYNIYQQMDARSTTLGERKISRGRARLMNQVTIPDHERSNKENEDTEIKYLFDGKETNSGILFQLCDVTDPDFACIINNPKYLHNNPTKLAGYYYRCVVSVIRGGMKKKLEQLADKGYADPINDLDAGLDKAVKREIAKMKYEAESNNKSDNIDEMDQDITDSQEIIDNQYIMDNDGDDDDEEDEEEDEGEDEEEDDEEEEVNDNDDNDEDGEVIIEDDDNDDDITNELNWGMNI